MVGILALSLPREDIIGCLQPGGIAVTNEILQLVIREGARLAEHQNLPAGLPQWTGRFDPG